MELRSENDAIKADRALQAEIAAIREQHQVKVTNLLQQQITICEESMEGKDLEVCLLLAQFCSVLILSV